MGSHAPGVPQRIPAANAAAEPAAWYAAHGAAADITLHHIAAYMRRLGGASTRWCTRGARRRPFSTMQSRAWRKAKRLACCRRCGSGPARHVKFNFGSPGLSCVAAQDGRLVGFAAMRSATVQGCRSPAHSLSLSTWWARCPCRCAPCMRSTTPTSCASMHGGWAHGWACWGGAAAGLLAWPQHQPSAAQLAGFGAPRLPALLPPHTWHTYEQYVLCRYETSNHLWLILEYCVGGDLMSLLRQVRPVGWCEQRQQHSSC